MIFFQLSGAPDRRACRAGDVYRVCPILTGALPIGASLSVFRRNGCQDRPGRFINIVCLLRL